MQRDRSSTDDSKPSESPKSGSDALREELPEAIPRTFSRIELIHQGDNCLVWSVRSPYSERIRVVKQLRRGVATDARVRVRFAAAIEAWRAAGNVNVPGLIDAELGGPAPYALMEHLDGQSLDAWLGGARRALPLRASSVVPKSGAQRTSDALSILAGMASALSSLHDQGLVHCAIHEAHLFVLQGPGAAQARLLGLSQVQPLRGRGMPRSLDNRKGAWAAPELSGGADHSFASDVYSLALVALALLFHLEPWSEVPVAELAQAKGLGSPLSSVAPHPHLPVALQELLERSLLPMPGERPDLATLQGALVNAFALLPRDRLGQEVVR